MTSVDAAVSAAIALAAARGRLNLSDYRRPPIERAFAERTAHLGLPPDSYLARLARDDDELDQLVRGSLVPVSWFYRDPEVFEALRRVVVPALARQPGPVRAWCAGAATGEEAWSLAMALDEGLTAGAPGGPARFDVLGTDVDAASLRIAERATFPASAAAGVPSVWRSKYLLDDGDRVRVAPALARVVRFEWHDLAGPALAPRSCAVPSFHLMLLRNVLIYFEKRLQGFVLARLRACLAPGGVLVLGPDEETASAAARLFVPHPALPPDLRVYVADPSHGT